MSLLDELISKFRSGDIVTRLVFINCAVFLVMLLLDINFTLFSFGEDRYAYIVCNYPWSPYLLARRPWSIVTSLFASWGLWHLIFNMIILYWLGNVFMRYFTSNNLRGLYILGGIAGMVVFTGTFSSRTGQAAPRSARPVSWPSALRLLSVCPTPPSPYRLSARSRSNTLSW